MNKHYIIVSLTNFRCFSDIVGPEAYLIEIGNNVTISANDNFITHDNSLIKLSLGGTDTFGKIKIGDNCFIGLGSIILPGVTLEDNIIVGAGSIVTKSFSESNIVIAGNPARKICTWNELKEKNKILIHDMKNLDYSNKKEYLLNLNEEMFIKR